jgi:hypothetical protein
VGNQQRHREEDEPLIVPDQAFMLRDGAYCFCNGRLFGPWRTIEIARAGLLVEQQRLAWRWPRG